MHKWDVIYSVTYFFKVCLMTIYLKLINIDIITDCTILHKLYIADYKFQRDETFLFLGLVINSKIDIKEEINKLIQIANESYFQMLKYF